MNMFKFGPMPFFKPDDETGTGGEATGGESFDFSAEDIAAVQGLLGLDGSSDDDAGGDEGTGGDDDAAAAAEAEAKAAEEAKAKEEAEAAEAEAKAKEEAEAKAKEEEESGKNWYDDIENEDVREIAAGFANRSEFLKALGLDPTGDWRNGIKDAKLRKHADRFASPTDLAKGHADLFAKLSRSLTIPGKDASRGEKAAFVEKVGQLLGVPEDIEGYAFAVAGKDETPSEEQMAARRDWAQFFKDHHVPKVTGEAMVAKFQEDKERGEQLQAQRDESFADEEVRGLKEEWGEDYDVNIALARSAADQLFGDDLEAMMKTKLSNNRLLMDSGFMLRALSRIGREMNEGSMDVLSQNDKDTLEDQIEGLREKQQKAQSDGKSDLANRYYIQEQELLQKLTGKAPIVGDQARSV